MSPPARLSAEETLRRTALAVSAVADERLYESLVRALAGALEVDMAFIALPKADCADGTMRMLACYVDGRVEKDFEYPLAQTPCETVMGRRFCIYASGLAERFPEDEGFRRNGFVAYAGYRLNDAQLRPLGLVSVVSRHPLEDAARIETVLGIFATRVAAELERRRADEATRLADSAYRAIFEASEDAIFVHDWDSARIVDVNPKACEMYGYEREALMLADLDAISSGEAPYTGAHALEHIKAARRDGFRQLEWHRRNRDGSLHWDEVRLKAVEIGGHRRILAVVREITERKRAEEALGASEAQYRAIFDASADGMVLLDERSRVVDANPAFRALFGRPRGDLLGRDARTLVPAESIAVCAQVFREAAAGGRIAQGECRALRGDGTPFDMELRGVSMQYQGSRHTLAIVRDVTGVRARERALAASEEQYRAVFDASLDALVLRDEAFRIVEVNPAYERMSGYRREEVLGADRVVANPAAINDEVRGRHVRALAGEPVRIDTQMVRRDGTRLDIELSGVRTVYQGRPHVLYSGRDVTARRHAESARVALEGQLRQAQKMEAIGQLTGGIAHDFNNLLTGIMGYIVLAAEREAARGDPKLARQLEQARLGAQHARDLIQQMLTFSRGRKGAPRLLDAVPAVEEAVTLLRASIPSTIELRTASERGLPRVMMDPVQLEQVLLNLCINARDAMPEGGLLRVAVRAAAPGGTICASCRKPIEGRYVELGVGDTGAGIPVSVRERMFEPFFSTKETGRGSGMGLATVHGIVHEHNGHILVDSAPGQGTAFRILLPVPADAAAALATVPDSPVAAPAATRLRGRVLLVDDERMVTGFMAELLTGWGFKVTVKHGPLEAEDWFARNAERVRLVITDQTMPKMTGIALAQKLVARRPGVPVVLYTGYAEGLGPAQLEAAGVRALIRKPVEPALLRETLLGLLAQDADARAVASPAAGRKRTRKPPAARSAARTPRKRN